MQPANPYPTPLYYPQEASGIFEDPSIYRKVDPDVLFFIFFYQPGTYQQLSDNVSRLLLLTASSR
jgi:CCR4-NOT transcription complex subunit 3